MALIFKRGEEEMALKSYVIFAILIMTTAVPVASRAATLVGTPDAIVGITYGVTSPPEDVTFVNETYAQAVAAGQNVYGFLGTTLLPILNFLNALPQPNAFADNQNATSLVLAYADDTNGTYQAWQAIYTGGSFSIINDPTLSDTANVGEFVVLTVSAPEPSTWAMMLIGFCGLSLFSLWKRHKALQGHTP